MRSTGHLSEWQRFLDAKTHSEATDALTVHVRYLEAVYNDLSGCLVRLWECPMAEIPDALLIARTAVAETMSLLEHVSVRVEDHAARAGVA